MKLIQKWIFAGVVWIVLIVLVLLTTAISILIFEKFGLGCLDAIWILGLILLINLLALMLSTRRYKDQMMEAGYSK